MRIGPDDCDLSARPVQHPLADGVTLRCVGIEQIIGRPSFDDCREFPSQFTASPRPVFMPCPPKGECTRAASPASRMRPLRYVVTWCDLRAAVETSTVESTTPMRPGAGPCVYMPRGVKLNPGASPSMSQIRQSPCSRSAQAPCPRTQNPQPCGPFFVIRRSPPATWLRNPPALSGRRYGSLFR
jgi:hypothetical protein